MRIFQFFSLVFILFLAVPNASAQFEFYRDVRSAGMGGVRVATSNDDSALISNPNGLRRVRGKVVHLLNGEVSGNPIGAPVLFATRIFKSLDLNESYEALSAHVDEAMYTKIQSFPTFTMKNFGFGILANHETIGLRDSVGAFHLNTKKDRAIVVGANTSFFGGIIKWGGTVRGIQREEFSGERNPLSESLELSDFSTKGMAVGVDTGVTFSLPWQLLPSLSVVWRDIGYTTFFGEDGVTLPSSVPGSLDAAFSVFPIFDHGLFGSFSIEVPDLLKTLNSKSFAEKIRVGLEVNRYDNWFFRVGYWNLTWTAGVEWAHRNFYFQGATYGVPMEIGNFESKEDRRWSLKLGFRL